MRVFKKFDLLVQIPFLFILLERMYRVFWLDDRQIFFSLWLPLLIIVVWQLASHLIHGWWNYRQRFQFHLSRRWTIVLLTSWLVCIGLFVWRKGDYRAMAFLFIFTFINIVLNIALLIFEIVHLDKFLKRSPKN
ncbi:MAG: hypothetical protein ACFB0B_22435 [Thermonemataceae bacterium]